MKVINIKFSSIVWIFFYLAIFSILLHNSFSYLDPDFGWHLKVGQQILEDRSVPEAEIYNYTLAGRTWVDHEWLINAITYAIYDKWGYISLNIFFALLIIVAFLIMHLIIKKYVLKENNAFALLIAFFYLGIIASLPHLGIRMQEITLLNISLLLLILYSFNKLQKNWILLFLIPLFYFWACAHAGFLIGIFILLLWGFVKTAELILFKSNRFSFLDYKQILPVNKIRGYFIFCLLAIAATFATPYNIKLYDFLAFYNNTFYLTRINEWLPFYYLKIQYWQLLYDALIVSIFLLIFYYALKKKSLKLPLWETTVSIIFLYLALKSKRHFPLFYLVSIPLAVKYLAEFLKLPSDDFLNKKWKRSYLIIKPYLIIGLAAIIASQLINTKFISDPFTHFNGHPAQAVIFLKDHPEYDKKNIYNDYGWGGYMIWMMPERTLFIDGRLPMIPFADSTLLEEYYKFWDEDQKKIEEKLDQYEINLVLIRKSKRKITLNWFEKYFLLLNEEKINDYKNLLGDYLKKNPDWKIAYEDNEAYVFVR